MTTDATRETFAHTLAHMSADELEQARARYEKFSLARTVPFPGYRRRHAILRRLCGVYPCRRSIPHWWYTMLDELVSSCSSADTPLIDLLREIGEEEFYGGCLLGTHVVDFKELGSRFVSRPAWSRSPRLARILQAFGQKAMTDEERQRFLHLYQRYQNRGGKEEQPVFIVSAHAWDILSMGSGKSYRTCQALDGDAVQRRQLPANLLDSGMLVAYIPSSLEAIQDRWTLQRMQARCILRLLFCRHRWLIYIDRCYGDTSLSDSLRKGITQLLQQHGITYWYRGLFPFSEEDDYCLAKGPLQFFPGPLFYPYLDAELMWHEVYQRGRTYHRLQGSLWLPRVQRSDANH
ncbi:MAG: hypothetical protein IMW90_22090 [Thermogemmatispora sp.]|uniref:hypothetical protein n=1 Tax=Thermogemmatispora sp. TaxID=1968838 RepID=UPI0019FD0A52|nr:hypothetical protein [Thermogemmatispora sp.]MBE3568417.1 hypothetical protein [Thermogemmatispora sp.]